jgi:hypothetical protein
MVNISDAPSGTGISLKYFKPLLLTVPDTGMILNSVHKLELI